MTPLIFIFDNRQVSGQIHAPTALPGSNETMVYVKHKDEWTPPPLQDWTFRICKSSSSAQNYTRYYPVRKF
jgi:hypothetical protein